MKITRYRLGLIAFFLVLLGCDSGTKVVTVSGRITSNPIIDPGGHITVEYTIDVDGNWSDVQSVEISGIPSNSDQFDPGILKPPASGQPVTVDKLIPAPALDGVYTLELVVHMSSGPQTHTLRLGDLTIRDTPGEIRRSWIEPADSHSVETNCSGQYIERVFVVDQFDLNGAHDVMRPRIVDEDPDGLLQSVPTVNLNDGNPRAIRDTVRTSRQFICNATLGRYTFSIEADQHDGVNNTDNNSSIVDQTLYRVLP